MSAYNNSPFGTHLRLLIAGVAAYFFGSWKQDVSPTQLRVTSCAAAAGFGTVGVVVYGGEIPIVSSLLSIQGTQTAGGGFNVVNASVLSVVLDNTGTGTLTFAVGVGDTATTADAGIAVIPQPEIPEAIVNGASVAVAANHNSFGGDLDSLVTTVATFPTLPNACIVTLQGAMTNLDSAYVSLGQIASVAGGEITQNGLTFNGNYLFYRALVSGVGGAGTLIVRIEA